jgi:hypothetical protein
MGMLSMYSLAGFLGLIVTSAAPPSFPAKVFELSCDIDGLYGPDGQPSVDDWRVDLIARKTCLMPGCVLGGNVTEVTSDHLSFTFPGRADGKSFIQTISIDRSTLNFVWSSTRSGGQDYTGTCRLKASTQQ